jgi:CCR4-NOT transcription complex subunit 9
LESNRSQAIHVWSYNGIPLLLLQEIVQAYYIINTDRFTTEESAKICVVLNITQILIEVKEVRTHFINSQLPFYLYPYLNISDKSPQYESLRIASLGVVGALLKDEYIINHLKNTEVVPLTLKIMDIGSEVSKIIASYIFLKIIKSNEGLDYACQTFDRFVAISVILNSMVYQCINHPSPRLLNNILECYMRLSTKENVKMSFKAKKPDALMNAEIQRQIEKDSSCKEKFDLFMRNISSVYSSDNKN